MAVHKQKAAAGYRDHGCQKPSARGRKQDCDEAQRQVARSQQPPVPAAFAVEEQRGQWEGQIKEAGHIVGILALGNKSNLIGKGLGRDKVGQGQQGQHPGTGHNRSHQSTQIACARGKLPDQPDNHHFLKEAAHSG
jgi:hypothetical protein